MPVILRTPVEIEQWMTAPVEDALKLQRPLPDNSLQIVAVGEKQDPPEAAAWHEFRRKNAWARHQGHNTQTGGIDPTGGWLFSRHPSRCAFANCDFTPNDIDVAAQVI